MMSITPHSCEGMYGFKRIAEDWTSLQEMQALPLLGRVPFLMDASGAGRTGRVRVNGLRSVGSSSMETIGTLCFGSRFLLLSGKTDA